MASQMRDLAAVLSRIVPGIDEADVDDLFDKVESVSADVCFSFWSVRVSVTLLIKNESFSNFF